MKNYFAPATLALIAALFTVALSACGTLPATGFVAASADPFPPSRAAP